ncbi:HET-domain-containing protein [Stipitochalara longipes BDJ]|nr:HET-domain-containing protein [Stipitochalara longipes BDJ]
MNKYKYSPLIRINNKIRLIKLHPCPYYEAPLVIEISHRSFPTNPQYEALSYAWGLPDRTQKISVQATSVGLGSSSSDRPPSYHDSRETNLSELCITVSLEVALRNLRTSQDPWIVWIDAICINQDDVLERGVEVLKMGDIYSKARRVIVWLGPEDENSSLAVETLEDIAKDVYFSEGNDRQSRVMEWKNSKTERLRRNAKAQREKVMNWVSVRELFQRAWFTRLWVFQEFELATEVVFLVRKDYNEWKLFKLDWGGSGQWPVKAR